jgi:hypothetical protein
MYVFVDKSHQGGRPATYVKELAFLFPRDSVDKARRLAESKMGLNILQVFLSPKVSFVVLLTRLLHGIHF